MSTYRENQAIDGGYLQNGSSSLSYERDNKGRRDSGANSPNIYIGNANKVRFYSLTPSPPASPTLPPQQESVELKEIRERLKDLEIDQINRYLKKDLEGRIGKEEKDDMLLEMLQEKDDLVVKLLHGNEGYRKEFEYQRTRLKRERGRLCDPKTNPSGHKRMAVKILQSQVEF